MDEDASHKDASVSFGLLHGVDGTPHQESWRQHDGVRQTINFISEGMMK